jgi:predicted ArsR family transcriptional regulator
MHPDDDPVRHAVLADPTRRALLAALRRAAGPLGIRDLAATLGLHANSVREQLRRLLRFLPTPEPEDPYRALALALADQLAAQRSSGLLPMAEGAGERWGRDAAARTLGHGKPRPPDRRGPGSSDPSAPTDLAIVGRLLAEAGYAPEPIAPGDAEIRLRACPFLPIDHRHLPVVCGVHLGYIRGAFRELGSARDVVAIEPFVRPDLCIARLSRSPRA